LSVKFEHDPLYLIDEILPSKEVHLMAGPTGAGKTRWLFDALLRWQRGLPILGLRSHPVPWVYVASDRSMDGVNRTFDTMGIDRNSFEILPAWDEHMSFSTIMGAVADLGAKFAVIEGFGQFVEAPAHTHQVRSFLQSTCTILKTDGCTILGVVECPKMKPRDSYANPRQRVSGAAAWGHHSETIFLVEPSFPDKPQDPNRTLTVCSRNYAGMVVPYRFSRGGRLEIVLEKSSRKSGANLNGDDTK
jgi:hypothetical protein